MENPFDRDSFSLVRTGLFVVRERGVEALFYSR